MLNPGLAWRIRARICRRDIADEPVARIATLTRISDDFILRGMCDNRRRSAQKGEKQRGLLQIGQENELRPRGLGHPEYALCLAELCPD